MIAALTLGAAPAMAGAEDLYRAYKTGSNLAPLAERVPEGAPVTSLSEPLLLPASAPSSSRLPQFDEVYGVDAGEAAQNADLPYDTAALDPEAVAPPTYELSLEDPSIALIGLRRLEEMVPAEMGTHFDLVLYVNKAEEGLLAQQMIVYGREDGALVARERVLVSTGRERHEGYFTTTPSGLYKLDPHRFREVHYSSRWGGVAMPWAMFFDYGYRVDRSGLAIHAANEQTVSRLGQRDSGGCIRLSPDHARALFQLILAEHRGMVPVFAFDDVNGHTDRTGRVERDETGAILLEEGLSVLLVVDGEIL